jgi:hypothetical protein
VWNKKGFFSRLPLIGEFHLGHGNPVAAAADMTNCNRQRRAISWQARAMGFITLFMCRFAAAPFTASLSAHNKPLI